MKVEDRKYCLAWRVRWRVWNKTVRSPKPPNIICKVLGIQWKRSLNACGYFLQDACINLSIPAMGQVIKGLWTQSLPREVSLKNFRNLVFTPSGAKWRGKGTPCRISQLSKLVATTVTPTINHRSDPICYGKTLPGAFLRIFFLILTITVWDISFSPFFR